MKSFHTLFQADIGLFTAGMQEQWLSPQIAEARNRAWTRGKPPPATVLEQILKGMGTVTRSIEPESICRIFLSLVPGSLQEDKINLHTCQVLRGHVKQAEDDSDEGNLRHDTSTQQGPGPDPPPPPGPMSPPKALHLHTCISTKEDSPLSCSYA